MIVILTLLLAVGTIDTMAKGSSRSSSRSSSFKSSSTKSSPAKTTTTKTVQKKASPTKQKATNQSTFKKKTDTNQKKAVKPKAVSKNKIDRKVSKAQRTKNTTAAKKYGNKNVASKAYKEKMVSSNNYKTSTPPKIRPAHIPQTVVIGGSSLSVGYYPIGGYYGYGYMDPITRMYVACAAAHMIADANAMQSAGYGHWNDDGTPVRYGNSFMGLFIFLGICGVVAIVVIVIKVFS